MHAPVRSGIVPQPCQGADTVGRLILRDGSAAHVRPATPEGGWAAVSHTAALAANATAADALFRQTGVIRAGSLEELFELALALECHSWPWGSPGRHQRRRAGHPRRRHV